MDYTLSTPDSTCPFLSLRGGEVPRSHGPQCPWSPCQSQLVRQAEPASWDAQGGMWTRLPGWGAAWSYFGSWLYRRMGWCRSQRHALTGSYLTSLWVPKMQTFGDSLKPLLHLVPTVFLRGREKVVIFFSFLHFLFYFLRDWIISSGKNLMLSTSLLMELRKISRGTVLGVSETLSGIKLRANSFPFQDQNLKKKKNLRNKL